MRRQQELLLEKIDVFDHTNRSLRDLLRGWSDNEVKEKKFSGWSMQQLNSECFFFFFGCTERIDVVV